MLPAGFGKLLVQGTDIAIPELCPFHAGACV